MSSILQTGGQSFGRSLRSVLIVFIAGMSIMAAHVAEAAPLSKKVAVIMFKPQNYGKEYVTEATVRSVVWTGATSANEFYKEESFGKVQLTGKVRTDGDIYGWYTIPYSNTGTCPIQLWIQSANQMAAKDGFSATGYDAIIYAAQGTGCPSRAWTSGSQIVVISGFGGGTIAHELGHAFGLLHASSWRCKDASGNFVTVSSNCSKNEYGDFAAMGQTGLKHMNAYMKGRLGFFAASNTKDVTTSGVYAIAPIEEGTTAVQSLRIPRTYDTAGNVKDYYYLEVRQVYGFDKFALDSPTVNGVTFHVAPPYNLSTNSYLLDTNPVTATSFADASLQVGQTFKDTTRKVTFTVVSVGPTAAYVNVQFN